MSAHPVGAALREWRQRRRMSQLELACEADISTRHLSFLETGRSLPSREMILLLSEHLDVPLRDRNVLLTAAGYAPTFSERPLDAPSLRAARAAVDLVLKGHEPYPALAVDRHWTMAACNDAVPRLVAGVDTALLQPPVNVLRLSLHPKGLAPRIVNLGEWRAHLLMRLRHQIELTADATLMTLLRELSGYPAPARRGPDPSANDSAHAAVVPLRIRTDGEVLSFLSTTTIFGTPLDITLSELALESFFPADAATASFLRNDG
jgi:transcriptional regulator with XRE-family HTH domain